MELVVNTQNFNQKAFFWNTDYTFTLNREKITELADGTDRYISNGWFVGHSIKTHYGLEKIGIWPLDEAEEAAKYGEKPGRIKIKDQNKDDSIDNHNDRVILGSETRLQQCDNQRVGTSVLGTEYLQHRLKPLARVRTFSLGQRYSYGRGLFLAGSLLVAHR